MNHDDFTTFQVGLDKSRNKILSKIGSSKDLSFIYSWGNIGDHLIWAGTRQLLKGKNYKEVFVTDVEKVEGQTALITGGGGWCKAFHSWPDFLPIIEQRFEEVIILPTSFETSLDKVKRTLLNSKAFVFARELESYNQIKNLCNSDYAYDCAFFFDFSQYQRKGQGTLNAFRTDQEQLFHSIAKPDNNNDISRTAGNLDQWLKVIAKHGIINTDRAHVMIASAMLGKQVYYRPSNYHKVPAIAEFSLRDFPVYKI
ncbi:polysaccharide pyruvyl transferase family protein [Cytobacillus firmus]|uniref:polysaccharide pyruvyl transferase family protein n=1 Tax=Cytobacillus firmus TaxID=1399 RepID=UPI0024955DF1|nr:polysaccharide pyruvyl transferase family protein [Cytobacillus firmus]